jgi:isopenicillin-N epimerase
VSNDYPSIDLPAANPGLWALSPDIIYLNHGAFGACPKPVLEAQNEWRMRLEKSPMQFLVRELETQLDTARAAMAQFAGAPVEDVVFVANATSGVNTVLRSLKFSPGDELIVTNQEYNASRNALDFVAERSGARVVVVNIPFPFSRADELITPILEAVTKRTRLVLIDHVTSQTGIILPIVKLVKELNNRGVDTLVDGAHAPGMVPLKLQELGAAYYMGNCHKWLCAPKSVALLYVRPDKREEIRPLTISHGANSRRKDRSRFLIEFCWQGTSDFSAALSVPEAIRFMDAALPGGWPAVMARNRELALAARKLLCETLKVNEPCPAEFIGSLACVPLPAAPPEPLPPWPLDEYPLQHALRTKHHIEVPLMPWPVHPQRLLRISAQLYNSLPQYKILANALTAELG